MASAEVTGQFTRSANSLLFSHTLPPSEVLKRDLRYSVGDGSAYGLMVGAGETYLQAFVLAIGMGEVFAALIATLPQLIGSLLQLTSPLAIKAIGSHKWWVVTCASVQALCFVPLILAAWAGYVSQGCFWSSPHSTGPAVWEAVPHGIRGKERLSRAIFEPNSSHIERSCVR